MVHATLSRPEAITEEIQREAVHRVLDHPLFKRSIRLRRFLTFVVEENFNGEDANLTEQQIGVALFGRQPSYDTGSDNIVRVYASDLRKRLEMYYGKDGSDDPVRIEIPRGAYRPVFHLRTAPSAEAVEAAVPLVEAALVHEAAPEVRAPVPEPAASVRGRVPVALLAVLAATLIAALAQSLRVRSLQIQLQPWRAGPALRELWDGFFQGRQPATVVLADTSFAMAQDLSGYSLTLGDYLNQSYLTRLESPANPPASGQSLDQEVLRKNLLLLANRNTGSMSDFRTARRILALDPTSGHVQMLFARNFSAETLRHGSTVLIGSSRSNPWAGIFQRQIFFQIESPSSGSTIRVRLADPRHGEPTIYATSADPNREDGFCVIALLPNPSGDGRTLIIAGTDSQATEAGGDFVAQESSLEDLRRRLGAPLDTPFQVLLRTSRAAGSPVSTEVVAQRAGAL